MENWLERANRYGDVLPSNTSLTHVQAGLASDIKDKILYAIKLGLGTGAILALLNVSGPDWESLIDKMRSEPAITDQYLEDGIEDVELESRVMDIPVSDTPAPPRQTQNGPDYEYISSYIGGHEGFKNHVYPDSYDHPTVGVGHKITPESEELFNELFGGEVSAERVKAGTQDLTDPQVVQLFEHDVQSRMGTARSLFPAFDTYNAQTQAALLDGIYRGDHKRRYRTTRLINEGRWAEAADEYLNNTEYLNAKAGIERGDNTTNAGIVPRMEQNAEVMRSNAN